MVQSRYRFVKSSIRLLKRRHGQSITIYNKTTGIIDYTTGVIGTSNINSITINKAVVLPNKKQRKSYLKGNTDIPYSGVFDRSQREFIVEKSDLGNFVLSPNSYLSFDSKQYNIKEIIEFEEDSAYIIVASRIEGQSNE